MHLWDMKGKWHFSVSSFIFSIELKQFNIIFAVHSDFMKRSQRHHILDIGTGVVAIYAILGVRLYPHWYFTCSDINQDAVEYAKLNIERNQLVDKINVIKVSTSDVLQHRLKIHLATAITTGQKNYHTNTLIFIVSHQGLS